MAKLENNNIVFDNEDIEDAWDNSIILENRDPSEFKMCYICKFFMDRKNFVDKPTDIDVAWNISIINLDSMKLTGDNFIAVHNKCEEFRPKNNVSKLLKRLKKTKWQAID